MCTPVAPGPSFSGWGGGGRSRSILQGEQWGEGRGICFPPRLSQRVGPACLAPGFACLSLPDLIASPRRWRGAVGLVHTSGAHSKGAVLRVQASTSLCWRWAAAESEAGPFQPSSSPFPGRVRPVHTPLVCDPA